MVAVAVELSQAPGDVLARASAFLASRPVLHNLVLTLLCARAAAPEPGRYWTATAGDEVVGVVFQSPSTFPATLTPMPTAAVDAAAAAVATDLADAGVVLPGVSGEAATAAAFAGAWTEIRGAAAEPVEGQRIYEVDHVVAPTGVVGRFRQAVASDRALLVDYMRRFHEDVGGIGPSPSDPAVIVDRHLPAGRFFIWDDDGGQPVSVAGHSEPVAGVSRIQGVYTPAEHRGHGYASACVAALSARVLAAGHRCILYTELANPTSNRIYRSIGYRAAAECLRYEFR